MKNKITFLRIDGFMDQNGFALEWSKEGFGFGNIYFRNTEDGKIKITTEYMDKEFIKEIVNFMLDNAEYED